MALQGKFLADFSDFYSAVQKAEVSLRSFETGANKVGTSLNRMTDQFSGRKVIQEATLMAEVFQRAGGTAAFTEKELARMGATGAEAVAKLRALGTEVPPGIQRMADATRTASGFWHDLGKQVLTTAAGFVSAQAVLHLVRLGFDAVKDAAKSMWDIALSGAAVADVEENFQRLTSQAGLLGDTLLGTLRAGTHATITDFELMKTVNQDLAAGMRLTDAQFGILAQGAFALAQATGGDVKTALDTMNDAMLTGRTRSLALLTGKIDLEAAEQKFAASISTTAKNLSEAGKLEAARVAILDGVSAATARLGVQTDGLDERVAQAQASWGNFKEELGKTVAQSTVLEAGLVGVASALTGTFGPDKQALIDAIASKIDEAAIALISVAETAVSAGGAMVQGFYGAKKVFGDLQQIIDGVRLTLLYVQQAAALGILPGTADLAKWQALDAQIGKVLDTMLLRGKALQEDDRAQAGVDATTQKYIATLEGVRAKMVAAGASNEQVAVSIGKITAAQAGVTAGVQAGESAWTKATVAVDAHAKAVQGLVDALSGAGAIEQVELLREALAKSGPISAMTLDAQKKINAMVREAIAVYAAAGQTIPADLLRIQAATTNLATATQDWLGKTAANFKQFQGQMVVAATTIEGAFAAIPAAIQSQGVSQGIAMLTTQTDFLTRSFSQLGPTIMGAMQGGGDAIKSVAGLFGGELTKKIFGGDAMKASISSIFGATLGSAFNALLPGIGALAGPLISKIGSLFKGVFGASESELAGRVVAKQFREELERTLTATQKLEAGNEQWKKSVIAVRDAYIANGRAGEEALVMMDRLWRAEKEGPEAVKRIIDEITAVMSGSFTNAIISTGQIVQETVSSIANTAIEEANRILDEVRYYDRGTGQTGMNARSMSPEAAQAAIDRFVQTGGNAAFAAQFLENNPGDEGRLESAYAEYKSPEDRPNFASGTGGKYLDFGGGTDVRLHGREEVRTLAQGQAEASAFAGLEARLRSMEQLLGRFPIQIRDALQQVWAR